MIPTMLLSKLKQSVVAVILGWTLLLSNPTTALARQDDDVVHYDARVQGYEPDVELKSSTTGMAWFLFFVLVVLCYIGMFKDAKRTHLD